MDIASEELSRYTVRKGDLLVCEGGEVGRAAIWGGSSTVGFQKALHRLRPRVSARDNPRFLYYALRAAAGSGIFKADGNESTIAHLTAEKLKRHRFPFPPVAEQDAIAERLDCALDRCDGARSAAAAHIELLREYRTRLVADVVTGRLDVRKAAERLPDDPDVADAAFDGGSER
jgi:type I restriction enzyme S subunit